MASSVEEHSLCKFLSSSDCGSKLAVRQVFFKHGKYKFFANYVWHWGFKKCRRSSNLEKIYKIWKNFCWSPNLWAKGNVGQTNWPYDVWHMSSYALLQNTTKINTATISSSAITLNLWQSNCDGWTWPRETMMTLIG